MPPIHWQHVEKETNLFLTSYEIRVEKLVAPPDNKSLIFSRFFCALWKKTKSFKTLLKIFNSRLLKNQNLYSSIVFEIFLQRGKITFLVVFMKKKSCDKILLYFLFVNLIPISPKFDVFLQVRFFVVVVSSLISVRIAKQSAHLRIMNECSNRQTWWNSWPGYRQ